MITITREDNMNLMARYPDNYFDLAIVDPPYGIGMAKGIEVGKWKRKIHTTKDWDDATPTAEYWTELFRVSKNQIVWGWNYYVSYFNDCPSYIVWNKEASGNYSDCEMAWCSIKGTNKIFKWLWNGFRKQQPEKRIHPTQKPVALYDWILHNYAKPNDLILDTHLGSGSSRIAAYKGGFNFVGFEIDSEYYQKQEKRFNEFKSQLRLF